MLKLKILLVLTIFLTSCKSETKNVFIELIDSKEVVSMIGVTDFETQWFRYPDSTCRNLNDLCVVKYYVNGDTLFTSEKYHFVSLGYSWDVDSTLAYHHIIFFNRHQPPNENGWYAIVIDKQNIPREPDTHVSSIALRSYCGERYDYKHRPHADAHLFNATKEIPCGRDRNSLSSQLIKLYDIIR